MQVKLEGVTISADFSFDLATFVTFRDILFSDCYLHFSPAEKIERQKFSAKNSSGGDLTLLFCHVDLFYVRINLIILFKLRYYSMFVNIGYLRGINPINIVSFLRNSCASWHIACENFVHSANPTFN